AYCGIQGGIGVVLSHQRVVAGDRAEHSIIPISVAGVEEGDAMRLPGAVILGDKDAWELYWRTVKEGHSTRYDGNGKSEVHGYRITGMREGARLVEEGIKVIQQVYSHLEALVPCSDSGEAVVAIRISGRCRQLQVSDGIE